MKHEYSTVALIVLFSVIFVVVFINAIDSGDMDILCNTNNSLIKKVAGTWICSQTHYTEGYYHNHTTPITVSITNDDTYYNVSGFIPSNYYGFTWYGSGINTNKAGLYRFSGSISFTGGNGGEYEFIMAVNGIPQLDCAMDRTATTTFLRNVGLTCFIQLSVDDHLNLQVQDWNDPAQDIDIYVMNLNIMEVQ